MYLVKINILLDIYASLIKINKFKLRFRFKPWKILGLQKLISVKNKLFTKFTNRKHPTLNEQTRIECKNYSKQKTMQKPF